jgi:hypothetical protein
VTLSWQPQDPDPCLPLTSLPLLLSCAQKAFPIHFEGSKPHPSWETPCPLLLAALPFTHGGI